MVVEGSLCSRAHTGLGHQNLRDWFGLFFNLWFKGKESGRRPAPKGAPGDLKRAFCAVRIEAVLLSRHPREHKAGRCISRWGQMLLFTLSGVSAGK